MIKENIHNQTVQTDMVKFLLRHFIICKCITVLEVNNGAIFISSSLMPSSSEYINLMLNILFEICKTMLMRIMT